MCVCGSGAKPDTQATFSPLPPSLFPSVRRYESYLSHSDPVVLALNPFFVLECVFLRHLESSSPETQFRPSRLYYFPCHRNDPTPDRGQQLPRASSLIVSSLDFIHDLRAGMLEPDHMRGTPLDMDQYTRLFGTARIPTEVCYPHPPYAISFTSVRREDARWRRMETRDM